ncbi:MAG: recombination protein RecR [Synergistaceae bacterium]|nr:recombination protein RecR [Synergistaceae bacterium]
METLNELINYLKKFPGIGKKGAKRIAFYLIKQDRKYLSQLGTLISGLRDNMFTCQQCGNISSTNPCSICRDPLRDHKTLCIVEDIEAIAVLEEAGVYNGLYHVLGKLSPIENLDSEDEALAFLTEHINALNAEEVIVAATPRVEGDLTYYALIDFLKHSGVKRVTRIAFGLPVGTAIEFADRTTLNTALEDRKDV